MPEQTSYSGPPDWMQQLWQNYLGGAFGVANRPYEQYQGPQVAGMSGITEGALGGLQGAMYGNPATWGGMQFLGDLIGGSANPYLDKQIEGVTNDATKAFEGQLGGLNSIFSNPNSFGGSRHALGANDLTQSFGKGLGQSIGNLRYGAFNDDLSRRMQATQMAQGMNNSQIQNLGYAAQMGNIPRDIQQQMFNQGQQNWREWYMEPERRAGWLGGQMGLGSGAGGQQSSTQYPEPNRWSQALGGLGMIGSGLGWFR